MKITRWFFLSIVFSVLALPASAKSLYDIPLKDINGKKTSLAAYKGKVILIVNVASECGLTPQYKALESLYQKHQEAGLIIAGFPSNDFGEQEPGSNDQIQAFCAKNYNVTFPLFDKVVVHSGEKQHPLYQVLTGKEARFPGDVTWNFGKFLVGRNGEVLARFDPEEEPDSPKIVRAIADALQAE